MLRAAAERVASSVSRRSLAPREEIAELARALAASVHWIRTAPGARLERWLRSPLAREILDALRDDVIHTGSRDRDASGDVLEILADIEQLRRAIEPRDTRAATAEGPSGIDLFVAIAENARSPLNAILFLSETLQREICGPLNPSQRHQVGLIYGAALALRSIAQDAVDLARRGAEVKDDEPVPFSVGGLLESVRDTLLPAIREHPLAVRVQLPTASTRVGHPLTLSRVLLNLTTHAVSGAAERPVELAAEELGRDAIRFSVRGEGGGDVAWQAYRETPRPRGRNADLGLVLCAELVEALGSELKVDAQRDRGARFCFDVTLPPWQESVLDR